MLQGNATVVGVVLRRNNFGDFGSIAASAGAVTLDGVKATGSAARRSAFPAVIVLSGTVHATMTPGNVADYCDQLAPIGQGNGTYGALSGSARLTVNGGLFGGAALGGSDGVNGAFNRGAFNLAGSSRLDLNNVVLNVDSSGIFVFGDATQVHLNASVVQAGANTGPGYGIHAAKGTPQITLTNSVISGFDNAYSRGSAGISVGAFAQPGAGRDHGDQQPGDQQQPRHLRHRARLVCRPSLTLTGSNCRRRREHAWRHRLPRRLHVDLTGGEISENATSDPAASGHTFHGGVWMGMATKTYQLRLRNMVIVDNKSTAGSNADSSSNSGVTMVGNAASGFDLGTGPFPGNNLIAGNTSSAQTTGLAVAVAPGITVRAVGNTFMANVQGANAQGKHQLGTLPCEASSCSVTSTSSPARTSASRAAPCGSPSSEPDTTSSGEHPS